MLTRREKLLVRPWQLRRYNSHRKKVLAALPVIDFGPPPERGHVTVKLKKLQLEDERKTRIEEDNFRLLQRMGEIMKKNRIDNCWERKPPTFLRRVGIYHRTRTPSPIELLTAEAIRTDSNFRKSRCLACSGQLTKSKSSSDEGRIPWEPAKKSPSKRVESALQYFPAPVPRSAYREKNPIGRGVASANRETTEPRLPSINHSRKSMGESCDKRIVLEQGPFKLALNFPIYVDVKVKSAMGEQYIQRSYCDCQALDSGSRNRKLTSV